VAPAIHGGNQAGLPTGLAEAGLPASAKVVIACWPDGKEPKEKVTLKSCILYLLCPFAQKKIQR
jgi:hypothetical protein